MKSRSALMTIIICSIFALLLSSCSQDSVSQETGIPVELPSPSEDGFPRRDGSTSTAPLGAQIFCVMMEVDCEWVTFVDGNRYLMPDLTGYQGDFPGIGHHGTHSSYLNLINNEADLILVARPPSMEELELARLSGVELDVKPVALDAFVFLANEDNPVEGLSLDELQRIYTGELTNWDQVGGRRGEIHPYQRDGQSGSQQLMLSLVMKGLPIIDAHSLVINEDDRAVLCYLRRFSWYWILCLLL